MSGPRYASGTSLDRTDKERQVDSFEHMVGDMSDGLFAALKRLTKDQLRELHRLVADRINAVHNQYRTKPEEDE